MTIAQGVLRELLLELGVKPIKFSALLVALHQEILPALWFSWNHTKRTWESCISELTVQAAMAHYYNYVLTVVWWVQNMKNRIIIFANTKRIWF